MIEDNQDRFVLNAKQTESSQPAEFYHRRPSGSITKLPGSWRKKDNDPLGKISKKIQEENARRRNLGFVHRLEAKGEKVKIDQKNMDFLKRFDTTIDSAATI